MSRSIIIVVALLACRPSSPPPEVANTVREPLAEAPRPTATTPSSHFVGVLTPKAHAEVLAPFTTTVTRFKAAIGEQVEPGSLLAALDDEPLRQLLDTTAADLRAARTARAQAAAALANQKKLFEAGVAAKVSVSDAAFALSAAAARVERAKADVKAVKSKLAKTTLVAPIAGKVALRYVEQGGKVTEGTPVVRVISSDALFLRFAIPTQRAAEVKPKTRVEAEIESGGKQVLVRGVVTHVAPELDPIAQMIVAEAELDDGAAELQAGLICRVHLR